MQWGRNTASAVPPPEAHERLLDVMLGDPSLYTRTDEVQSAWRFISQILDAWDRPEAPPPDESAAGNWGPASADALIARDGARWRRLQGAAARDPLPSRPRPDIGRWPRSPGPPAWGGRPGSRPLGGSRPS